MQDTSQSNDDFLMEKSFVMSRQIAHRVHEVRQMSMESELIQKENEKMEKRIMDLLTNMSDSNRAGEKQFPHDASSSASSQCSWGFASSSSAKMCEM
eukprot:CAMPEP_0118687756 /NCGR_PEP_ID=MMETSP0800-20121206/8556_1 /TAXON_ID=210618 ORGANISM="Striatella unipunctata, Strain CCMP2910" /NCGR_SAMPLE_ID=MMETSP0800 /ASSEMBLY_ACC=CAM_ASM_000638 /LENGTH=96 /DNA_ID=CAMNT_0006584969 /DNA_START=93 /DNA_END=383 /DNA_ORIENTATION=-